MVFCRQVIFDFVTYFLIFLKWGSNETFQLCIFSSVISYLTSSKQNTGNTQDARHNKGVFEAVMLS